MSDKYQDIKTAIIYGAGSGGAKAYEHLTEEGIEVIAFIDDFKTGEYFGKPIIKLKDLEHYKVDAYFIGTAYSVSRIFDYIEKLKSMGISDDIYISFVIPAPTPIYDLSKPPYDIEKYFYLFEDNEYKRFLERFWKDIIRYCDEPFDKDKFFSIPDYFNKGIYSYTNIFLQKDAQKQYTYEEMNFDVEKGDIVLDCGANSSKSGGTQATYFASKSEDGMVYAFEPIPRIYNELLEDIKAYKNIIPIQKAVWDENTFTYFTDMSSGSRASSDGDIKVELIRIDDFVKEYNIPKVDFIKMDIEGAELNALKGAEHTIKIFKPKLAISIYHKPEHFYEIPMYIKSIVPEYKMWILNNEGYPWSGTKVFCKI